MACEFLFRDFSRKHRTQSVRPTSCGVFFVKCSHVGRAHGAVQFLSALPHTTAHLHGPDKATLSAEIQGRIRLPCLVLGADLQRFCHGGGVYYLSWIHEILWIKRPLHLTKGFIENRPKKFLVEMASRQAIAVLTRHGTIKFENQI